MSRLLSGSARVLAASAALGMLVALSTEPLAQSQKRVVVQGKVTDDRGAPLTGWPVSLIRTKRYVELTRKVIGGDVEVAARVQTDADGYFTIDIPRDRSFHFYFIRFLDPEHFNSIQYVPPADWEITSTAKRGRVTQITKVIALRPDWDELQRRLAAVGGESSQRGRVLRTIGLPDKTVATPEGVEEWWYFSRGVMYMFRGDDAVGEQRFEPVISTAATPAAGS